MRLAIGTAQFGMNYGVTNISGKVLPSIVDEILALARENRINYIDTAAGYGDAEKVIGLSRFANDFKVISKIPALPESGFIQSWFEDSLRASLANLKCETLNSLLVHKADDLLGSGGADLWAALQDSKKSGKVERIGFSVYTVEQTSRLLEKYSPDLIQFPLSLLDQRFLTSGMIAEMSDQAIALHARSVFLQGLLLASPNNLPTFASSLGKKLGMLDRQAKQLNTSRMAFLIGFVQTISELEAVVVGITSPVQLKEIIEAWHQVQKLDNFTSWSEQDPSIVDPSQWKR